MYNIDYQQNEGEEKENIFYNLVVLDGIIDFKELDIKRGIFFRFLDSKMYRL